MSSSEQSERFGRAISARRDELGLTFEEISRRGGPSTTLMGDIEAGRWTPGRVLSTFKKLDAALEWDRGQARAVWQSSAASVQDVLRFSVSMILETLSLLDDANLDGYITAMASLETVEPVNVHLTAALMVKAERLGLRIEPFEHHPLPLRSEPVPTSETVPEYLRSLIPDERDAAAKTRAGDAGAEVIGLPVPDGMPTDPNDPHYDDPGADLGAAADKGPKQPDITDQRTDKPDDGNGDQSGDENEERS